MGRPGLLENPSKENFTNRSASDLERNPIMSMQIMGMQKDSGDGA
jgi:hypothetical protein